jgi:hypothetical protein
MPLSSSRLPSSHGSLLVSPLDRHKAHRRTLNRLADRFRIGGIVLIALDVRLHILRRHQSHLVPKRAQLPRPVVRRRARLRQAVCMRSPDQCHIPGCPRQVQGEPFTSRPRVAGLQQQIESLLSFQVCIHTLAHSSMENDLRARVQTLARLRRGRIGVSDLWDSSGGTDRDNYLSSYPAPAALLIPANSASRHRPLGEGLREYASGFRRFQESAAVRIASQSDYWPAALMPRSFAISAILARCCSVAVANSTGPPRLTI